MSESQPKAKAPKGAAADDGELDKVADELYALRPDEFAAKRDEEVKKARAEGRAALARELNKLRKPTQSAWLINLLWRDQRDVMEQLLELGQAFGQAQAQASGPELLRLTGQRRELEAALMRQARALAEKSGVSVSAPMEREAQETLSAAVAMPEVADEVRSGRLVKPAAYSGFGSGFGGLIPPGHANRAEKRAAEATDGAEPKGARPASEPKPDELASKRAAAVDRGKKAQAQAALDAAAGVLADRERALEAAGQLKQELEDEQQQVRQRMAELQKQLDEVRQRQRDLQAEVVAAEQATLAAGRRRDQAEKTHASARQALEQVEQQLKEPT